MTLRGYATTPYGSQPLQLSSGGFYARSDWQKRPFGVRIVTSFFLLGALTNTCFLAPAGRKQGGVRHASRASGQASRFLAGFSPPSLLPPSSGRLFLLPLLRLAAPMRTLSLPLVLTLLVPLVASRAAAGMDMTPHGSEVGTMHCDGLEPCLEGEKVEVSMAVSSCCQGTWPVAKLVSCRLPHMNMATPATTTTWPLSRRSMRYARISPSFALVSPTKFPLRRTSSSKRTRQVRWRTGGSRQRARATTTSSSSTSSS